MVRAMTRSMWSSLIRLAAPGCGSSCNIRLTGLLCATGASSQQESVAEPETSARLVTSHEPWVRTEIQSILKQFSKIQGVVAEQFHGQSTSFTTWPCRNRPHQWWRITRPCECCLFCGSIFTDDMSRNDLAALIGKHQQVEHRIW